MLFQRRSWISDPLRLGSKCFTCPEFIAYYYIAGNFFPKAHSVIGYFKVTWHLTMKLFPAKISEQATLQNQWCQRVTVHCNPQMLTTITVRFNEFPASKFPAITNYLKTGPLGNSSFCFTSENIEILRKPNYLFPLGPVINCLMSNGMLEPDLSNS